MQVAIWFTACCALAGCFGAASGLGPVQDRQALESAEHRRLSAEGVGRYMLSLVSEVDGEVGLVGVNPGEGWATSIYRRIDGRWKWIADKGNAPAPCLFAAARASAEQARDLTAALFSDAKSMKPDIEPVPCRFKPLR